MREKFGRCPLCARECPLTFHHLIPRKLHRRTFFKKRYSSEDLNRGIDVCRLCHNGIHALYDEMTLGKRFDTLRRLRSDSALKRHFQWVAKQKVRSGALRTGTEQDRTGEALTLYQELER